jgi:FKBP-type peptidyl-prolyl cis-trans isomerase FklB
MLLRRFRGTLLVFSAASLFCITPTLAQDDASAGEAAAEKPKSPMSYLLGLVLAQQMKAQGVTADKLDLGSLVQGFRDELGGKQPRLSNEEMQAADAQLRTMMQESQQQQRAQAEQRMQAAAFSNKEKAELFLQQNAENEGVKKLAEGLQYKVEKEGDGESPTINSRVKVHYTGRLLDGTVFDSSVERGQPATFPIDRLIEAWKIALPKMQVGDKWTLYAAPEVAYGERGSPPAIGPNELLIFEMELLDIVE